MKKVLSLSILLILTSCHNDWLSFEKKSDSVSLSAPRVYLSYKDQFLKITELNRGDSLLHLSDKIIFSRQWKPENDSSKPVLWNDLEPGSDFRLKVSSFCSYDKQESQVTDSSVRRVFKEMTSSSYSSSFSVFEILPQEILLNNLDEVFYCSFIFAFKNEEGHFNHYNIAQQAILPSFEGDTASGLSLIRETETGYYLPADYKILPQHISKISILNNTGTNNQKYHLFCSGLKLVMAVELNFNVAPVAPLFFNLASNRSRGPVKEGLETCRFISESNKSITGMTKPFQLDLGYLKNSGKPVDLEDLASPVVLWGEDYKSYPSGAKIPLNSYFSFENLTRSEGFDYNNIDIRVNTSCVNRESFGEAEIVVQTYKIPFRKKFPVMAVTPKELFLMDMDSSTYDSWVKIISAFNGSIYHQRALKSLVEKKQSSLSSCLYNIELKDRHNKEHTKAFELNYHLEWSYKDYGVDHKPLFVFVESGFQNQNIIVGEWINRKYSEKILRIEKPFLSLKEDIYKNEVDYFYPNFFDAMDDSLFQMKGPNLDRVHWQCHGKKEADREPSFIEVSQAYNALNRPLSLKVFFLNPDMQKYIQDYAVITCRLMFYEDQMLRYFSKEIRVTP